MKIVIFALPAFFLVTGAVAAPAATPAQIEQVVSRAMEADANHDGMLTRAEWQTWRATQFARLDRNGDGYLTDADVPAIAAGQMVPKIQAARAALDANHDGRISRDEFVNGPMLVFDQIDLDHNEIIDGREIEQAKGR
ncbi:EF-hand domain-containing protein [Asticcacaulis sp. 201]|uniref:EF-hand domain-containing protein n=1 Tax=Asticcacaulis sp. 201 TaxID=3028787 RepID=UPI0029163203|nr:EF-hand domain-containing protein [Asticcacaulis sp. 201]MDV6332899.1 EF-hand domain-containing protein [Asticcacaulis sp. 201]